MFDEEIKSLLNALPSRLSTALASVLPGFASSLMSIILDLGRPAGLLVAGEHVPVRITAAGPVTEEDLAYAVFFFF